MGGMILILACQDDGIGAATLGSGDQLEHLAPKAKKGAKKAQLHTLGDLMTLILAHYRRNYLHNQKSAVPVVLGFSSALSKFERQKILELLEAQNFHLLHQTPYELSAPGIGEASDSSVLQSRQVQLQSLLEQARQEVLDALEEGNEPALWRERASLLGVKWEAPKNVFSVANASLSDPSVDAKGDASDQSDTMSPKTELKLPSIKDVFELQQPLPPQNGQASFWRLQGIYTLGRQSKILHGLTNGGENQQIAFESIHRREKRYYEERVFVSAINKSQEGLYYHRDYIEEAGTLLCDLFPQQPSKLSLQQLEVVAEIYDEANRLVNEKLLYHPSLRADDVLILPRARKLSQKVLGLGKRWEVLFLNFPYDKQKVDMESIIHKMLVDTIGPAYEKEFAQYSGS